MSFFDDSASLQLQQQYARVEKLATGEVTIERIRSEKAAIAIYRVSPLKKNKSNETIPYNEQFVLLDKKGFIRGFYDGTDPEDVDRLTAEVKILLDIYKKEEN
ncbi:MAG: hypothetical protein U0X91_15860 [Spirosomataceae bacterium]